VAAERGRQREFDDPVPGMKTLRDAANYIMKLPKAEQAKPHGQAAAEAVLMATEDRGPLLHARVGMLRALNHGKPDPAVTPRRKRTKRYRIVR
jgi:hypothetical protein